jgi:hypothetical protein
MNAGAKVRMLLIKITIQLIINIIQANVDECARAAEIYQCGKENAPLVTNAVQSGLTDLSSKPKVFFILFFWPSLRVL